MIMAFMVFAGLIVAFFKEHVRIYTEMKFPIFPKSYTIKTVEIKVCDTGSCVFWAL
jgi:hypothetical protein